MAVKFPLKMSGAEVRTMEDLHKHFDITAVIEYYKNGQLLKWLKDRYYDEEAEKIEGLIENTSDFNQQLCKALGVEYDESDSTNAERLREKKEFLQQYTTEAKIINNADKTALNQEDLADLLDAGTSKIYLYGGSTFNVPIRVTDKNYIGILGTPTINIRAKSQADLNANNITFENCKLPFTNTTDFTKKEYKSTAKPSSTSSRSSVDSELVDTFEVIFGHRNVWNILDRNGNVLNREPSTAQKKMFLKMVCDGTYEENDLIHLCADEDFTAGWAFTKDSFCVGGAISLLDSSNHQSTRKILYSDIDTADMKKFNMPIDNGFNSFLQSFALYSNKYYREFVIIDIKGNVWQLYCDYDISGSNSLNPSDNWDMFGENSFDDGSFTQYGIKILPNDGSINEPIIENTTTFKSLTDNYAILSEDIKIKIAKFLNFAKK